MQVLGFINVAGDAKPAALHAIDRELTDQEAHPVPPTLASSNKQRGPAQEQRVPRKIAVEGTDHIRIRNLRPLDYPLDCFGLQPSEIAENYDHLLGVRHCGQPCTQ